MRTVVAVNNTAGWTDFRLFVRDAGAPEGEVYWRRLQTTMDGHVTDAEKWGPVTDGYLTFDMPPFSSIILCNEHPRVEAQTATKPEAEAEDDLKKRRPGV